MRPDIALDGARTATSEREWNIAADRFAQAKEELAGAVGTQARRVAWDRVLQAERTCTRLLHRWLGSVYDLQPVREPTLVLSLDVDGVLEDESRGFSGTGLVGAAALKLLQLGRVAVLLNTARSLSSVRSRTAELGLLGGVAGFGAATWDAVFKRETVLVSERAMDQFGYLRESLLTDESVALDSDHGQCVRASRLMDAEPAPIPGSEARRTLDEHALSSLGFWVAPRYTDFVDRGVDKGAGITKLTRELGLRDLPIASIGDSACDIPMLRIARFAFIPAATLPSYIAPRGQRLWRSRHLGEHALWEAACRLVPKLNLQRLVLGIGNSVEAPDWLPLGSTHRPMARGGWRPRLAAALPLPRHHLN